MMINYSMNDQNYTVLLCSMLKLIEKKLHFPYLPNLTKALLGLEVYIIYFMYCLFLKIYYIHFLCY